MTIGLRRSLLSTCAIAGAAALALSACSPGAQAEPDPDESGETTTVTFRLWDENAADAYEKSFDEFTDQNPGIKVDIDVVPWGNYWDRLPQDISSGTMADIFWTNTSNYGIYADQDRLIDIGAALGDDHDAWNPSVVDLYTRDGSLWGVPQLSDSIALFYNKDLTTAAGVDPSALTWSPDEAADTLLPALQKLTVDAAGKHPTEEGFDATDVDVWGFNAQADLQAIWLDFLAQNGGTFQNGDEYAFDSPEGVEAFQYLVDLINTYQVAPPAADTNANGDLSRDLFVQGKLALFQSGQYSLPAMADATDFEWAIAPMVAGPQGRIGVVHGVAALGNADTPHLEATTAVLAWLGSAEGQRPLGEQGAAFPAALDAQDTFTAYWDEQGVDTSAFAEAAAGPTTPAPVGPRSNAGLNAIGEVFPEMFAGRLAVADALEQAQQNANEAIAD
ncbi:MULTISPECIES: sugar ABC transporter substrate-binding protein [unclassified Pseudactinotalea]|uniref:ABC transporter substrate-binding protein n=1 Tax=unclassified Pseudactinotalea TaxID=2649176 RepID=UPI00128CFB26|nr:MULTISPECIES: sugar ABC transporter substrate-binding protein [unclassified Pseudactinotalea]MPV49125.1 extracellular solute-binding protein [Pseudactinotalea sp. HY160]QGH68205.1 extracellular solute-binding protein [Pseudactinotalea sp. HY158]